MLVSLFTLFLLSQSREDRPPFTSVSEMAAVPTDFLLHNCAEEQQQREKSTGQEEAGLGRCKYWNASLLPKCWQEMNDTAKERFMEGQ